MARQTILITGGAGFIGSHLAKVLLNRGDRVVIVDNFNDYYDPQIKKDRIKDLKKLKNKPNVHKVDVADKKVLRRIFSKYKLTKICHLAGQAGVRYSIENPYTYEESNVLGTLNMLELAKDYKVKDFIFASSSSVYGANKKMPFKESDKTETPMSLYAATKKTQELMAYTYHSLYGLNCTGLRFFTVYGDWYRPDMALFLFAEKMFSDKPINVFNKGKMKRDFTYIDDIVNGVVAALDKAYPYEVFNLAGGKSVELMTYIKELEKAVGKKAKKRMLSIQAGDVPGTAADISKARKMLNYNPQTTIQTGIQKFVDWYKEYYRIRD